MAALGPEVIGNIGGFKVTNTLVTTILVDIVLLTLAIYIGKHVKTVPGKIQSIAETFIAYFYDLTRQLTGKDKEANAIFPWAMSFFIVIFITNILGLMPGVGSIGLFPKEGAATTHEEIKKEEHKETPAAVTTQEEEKAGEEHLETVRDPHAEDTAGTTEETKTGEHKETPVVSKESAAEETREEEGHASEFIPLLRPATSDFNATLALAFVSLIATHVLSIKYTGIKDYVTRFISLNPILLFVGLLELVSEVIKMFSLSFRLFGNIYAGEVALHTVSTIHQFSAFLAPIPFLLLESIVAIVQALVFSMLTLVFMSILIKPHHAEGGEH